MSLTVGIPDGATVMPDGGLADFGRFSARFLLNRSGQTYVVRVTLMPDGGLAIPDGILQNDIFSIQR